MTLFISHASHDKALVQAFVDLLESGVGVQMRSIFCSSLKGQSIKLGADFTNSIRTQLDGATVALALISEAYYASAFCMCELGGVWIQSKSFLPILVPPLDFGNLKAVLSGMQVGKIDRADGLDEIRDEVSERLAITPHPTPRWNSKRDDFLERLPNLLKQVQFKGAVQREHHEKLMKEFEDFRTEYAKIEKESKRLEQLVEELKKAKDATTVRSIMRAHTSVGEKFEELAHAAAAALAPFDRCVREAFYYRARREHFDPDEHGYHGAKRQVEDGYLEEVDGEFTLRLSNAKVRKACDALDDLQEWLEGRMPGFAEWYSQEYDEEEPDMLVRGFWKRHLG